MNSKMLFTASAVFCLVVFLPLPSDGFELFSEPDFKGTIPFVRNGRLGWMEYPDDCFNFPSSGTKQLSSVKANSFCAIFYDQSYCKGNSFKVKENIPDLSSEYQNVTFDDFNDKVVSFQFCNEFEGAPEVDVNLYPQPGYLGNPLQYENVCRCTSIPSSLRNISSIDNHHNCVSLYSTPDCDDDDENKFDVLPGKSSVSQDLTNTSVFGKVESFRPCESPPKCFQFNAEVYLYNIKSDENAPAPKESDLSMNAKTVFKNNGSATVTQQYSIRRAVREVKEIERIKFSQESIKWSHSEKTVKEFSIDNFDVGWGVGQGVESAYSDLCEVNEETMDKYILEETKEFTVSQKIEVPPCTLYVADATLRIIEDFSMEYRMYFKLSGEFAGKKMDANELINELGHIKDYEYNHTIDNYSVSAFSKSYVKATFGVETSIVGEGTRIPNCMA